MEDGLRPLKTPTTYVSSSANDHPLTIDRVAQVLNRLGVVDKPENCAVSTLGGGVSSLVFLAVSDGQRYVVKQARADLAVRELWTADVRRTATEAHAARLLASLLPNQVPRVVVFDDGANVLVMEAAPVGVATWKELLLAGRLDPRLASEAGSILARIHEGTRGLQLPEFLSKRAFVELRVNPYLRTVADRHPDLTVAVEGLIDELLGAEKCLVHGDFSPKNLLVTPEHEMMLIDHEVAHLGDPTFDLAFFLPHLAAKAVRGGGHPEVIELMSGFLDCYASLSSDWDAISAMTPALASALLLARIDGKSPLEYLSRHDQDILRILARSGISQPSQDLHEWVQRVASLL